ncbi:LysR family transcriptional regulator [Burkholderia sp. Ap-962]|uniref:LysR family transcriptional regulator n=1 Tax=Burkholderia sp. Ap-962 TaxID=2608333 RepID=UPI00142086E7|nr:LysR family transcriptional regulator [Burkholderia sp. Ap-962]NIF71507.1 LysR family transcriptional regulator [Burkholderia sp. Ap-962]
MASLETVCNVARHGSFLAAAEISGLTHGAISRRIAAVENWLGVKLFERHARGVRPTLDGQRFVSRIEQAFGIIDSAADQWRSPRSARLVKLSMVPAFASLWFLARHGDLENEAPALRIELDIDHRAVDIAGGQADLAIRYGRGNWRHLEARPFLPETLYPVAHPALAAQLAWSASLQPVDFGMSAFALVPALLGMAGGQVLRGRVGERAFRRVFFAGLVVLGIYMAIAPAHA